MPDPDVSVHCSDFARSIDLSPGGTAIAASVVAVVETPLPWPKPVFKHQLLEGGSSTFMTASGSARMLASVPQSGFVAGETTVRTFWRSSNGTMCAQHQVGEGRLGDFIAELTDTGASAPSFEVSTQPAHEYSLVCTQGSHDICCGGAGMRYAAALDKSDAEQTVFRVSHTGGHRFAPTALTFPTGRMWAFLTETDAAAITSRSVSTASLALKCRGWWGAATGAAQVAEIAVWAEVGWDWDDAKDRDVSIGDSGLVQVRGLGQRWEVEVVPGRQVPSIACNQPGGIPPKPGQEWDLVSIRKF